MTNQQSKIFLDAWKKGAKMYPDFFEFNTALSKVTEIHQLKPINYQEWCIMYRFLSHGSQTFLSTMASFYDAKYWDSVETANDRVIQCKSISDISRSLDDQHREIIKQLFINY